MKKPGLKCLLLGMVMCVTTNGILHAQSSSDTTAKWGAKIYGFLRNDVIYDTRQMAAVREGELSLFPLDISPDSKGKDINAAPTLNMAAILSRAGFTITGPDAFGAKTSGVLEGEFWGAGLSSGNTNGFNLRHAYMMLDWSKTQLAFGQYWNPMFNIDCYPGVVNFNTGIPFEPLNRCPQIRLTQKLDRKNNLSLILAAMSQIDMTSVPSGVPLAQGVVPDLHAQLKYKTKKLLLGAGVDYLSLQPDLTSGTPAIVSTERVNSLRYLVYAKVSLAPVVIKAQFTGGQNLADQLMLGGYLGYQSSPTSVMTYKPTNTTAAWLDINTTGKKFVPGLFAGYTSNGGSASTGASAAFMNFGMGLNSASNIKDMIRVSPRMEFISGKFKFAVEIEYSSVNFGTSASDATVSNTHSITETRLIFMSKYSF